MSTESRVPKAWRAWVMLLAIPAAFLLLLAIALTGYDSHAGDCQVLFAQGKTLPSYCDFDLAFQTEFELLSQQAKGHHH